MNPLAHPLGGAVAGRFKGGTYRRRHGWAAVRSKCPSRQGCTRRLSTLSGGAAPPPPLSCTLRGHSMSVARCLRSLSLCPISQLHLCPSLPSLRCPPSFCPPSSALLPASPLPPLPSAPGRLTCRTVLVAPQGKAIRCVVGRLAVEVAQRQLDDILIRPSVPSNRSLWGACTTRTMKGLQPAVGRQLQESWPSRSEMAADDLRRRVPAETMWRFNAVKSSRVKAT